MKPAELAQARGELVAFAAEVLGSLPRCDQRRWGETYLRGLMLDGRRQRLDRLAAPVEHQAAQVGLAPTALVASRQRGEHLRREGDQLAARLGKLRRPHELRVLGMVPPTTTMISSPGFAAAQRRPAQANGVLLGLARGLQQPLVLTTQAFDERRLR